MKKADDTKCKQTLNTTDLLQLRDLVLSTINLTIATGDLAETEGTKNFCKMEANRLTLLGLKIDQAMQKGDECKCKGNVH